VIFHNVRKNHRRPVFVSLLDKLNVEYCILLDDLPENEKSGIITYEHIDYTSMYRSELLVGDNNWYIPPEILIKLTRVQVIALAMMDRISVDGDLSYRQRTILFYKYCAYWWDKISKNSIEIFISLTIPHEVFDYICYEMCRCLGVQTVIMSKSKILGLYHVINQLEDFSEKSSKDSNPVDKMATAVINDYFDLAEKHSLSTSDLQKYKEKKSESIRYDKNKYTTAIKKILSAGASLLNGVMYGFNQIENDCMNPVYKSGNIVFRIYRFLELNSREKEIKYEYDSCVTPPDLNKKYIYFPLHYQPEMTTIPRGDLFYEQNYLVSLIANNLPEDWFIYIKEHRVFDFRGRYRGYYKQLIKNKRVKILPINYSSHSLMKSSMAIASVTGTAVWEGLLQKKLSIVFGYQFYTNLPGIYFVRSEQSLIDAIEDIKKEIPAPMRDEIRQSLLTNCVNGVSINAFIEEVEMKYCNITEKINAENIVNGIMQKI